jgi:hypothetical protein
VWILDERLCPGEPRPGAHLWAEKIDGDLKDVFELQDEVTARVAGAKVIASSPSDVQPVFQSIAERSNRLVEGR